MSANGRAPRRRRVAQVSFHVDTAGHDADFLVQGSHHEAYGPAVVEALAR